MRTIARVAMPGLRRSHRRQKTYKEKQNLRKPTAPSNGPPERLVEESAVGVPVRRSFRLPEFESIRLQSEELAELRYRPTKCRQVYRVVVVRKNLSVEKGERVLFDDIRYFFYITNDGEMPVAEVVFIANDLCNQENLIEQLKNGIGALRMPVHDLVSNWAYMVIVSLAWSLKAWLALVQPKAEPFFQRPR